MENELKQKHICSMHIVLFFCSLLLSKKDTMSRCPFGSQIYRLWTWKKELMRRVWRQRETLAVKSFQRSTPYEKKTRGWSGETHALMLSQGHLLLKPKRRFSRRDVAQWGSSAAPKCLAQLWNETTSTKKLHLFQASFCIWSHTKSCLWCDSTCLTFQNLSPAHPTGAELIQSDMIPVDTSSQLASDMCHSG